MSALWMLLLVVDACALVKPTSPAQYLTYETHGKAIPLRAGESNEHVWFRFHNNTTCPVKIPAATLFLMRTLPNGRITDEPPDGQELNVDVSFTRPGGPPPYFGAAGLIGVVPAGQTVVFRVPANLLMQGPIAVRFMYVFENYEGYTPWLGETVHAVLYNPKYLDEAVLSWLSKALPAEGTAANP